MNNFFYAILAIFVISLVTVALRAMPFLLFSNKTLPKIIQYLSKVLPPAIMTILVIYCLKNTNFSSFLLAMLEIASCILVVLLQVFSKNMYLSIVLGTLCYMFLLRL